MKMKRILLITAALVLLTSLIFIFTNKIKKKPIESNYKITESTTLKAEIKVKEITQTAPKTEPVKSDITTVKAELPIVPEPPTTKVPKEPEEKHTTSDTVRKEEIHEVKEGDTEYNPEPPKYEETKVTEKQKTEPKVTETRITEWKVEKSESTLVPDSENPFMQPPKQQEENYAPGEHDVEDISDYTPGTGDKF